jgi:hypothetical protein
MANDSSPNFQKVAPALKNVEKPRFSRCGFEKGEARTPWSYGVKNAQELSKTAVFEKDGSLQVILKSPVNQLF